MTRKNVALMFQRLCEHSPSPKTELYYKDPFTLVVAVALSAQATDEGVNKATKVLFDVADTPEKMAALGEKKLGEYVKTIGLWRNKAKNVVALSKMIIDDFGGEVPQTREELEKLPGVGRKTANVVMNVAFGAPTIAVDTHIFRVGNRTGAAPGKTPLEVEKGLEKVVPEIYLQDAHHWLILHGRYICTAMKAPDCPNCKIADLCLYKDKTKPGEKKLKKKTKKLAGAPKLRKVKPKSKTKRKATKKKKTA
ncbi:MAG: endonuclease III [Marinicaulis sp.]|nr:endonuclease III [Marinicaulis sp.]